MSLSLADAEVLDALRDIGDALHATNQLGLAFDEPLITPWVAAKPKLTCSFSDADPAAVLTWLARTLNVSITLNGDRYVIHSLPDPARVHGDRLRGAQASDFPPYCRQAIEQYRAAVARGRDLLESYKAIGDIYRENAQWADGEKAYADFLALGVRDPYVLMEHGNCLRELGRYDDSFESLAEALEKEPADNAWLRSWIRVALGRTYIEVKRYAEAEKQIQEAVDILPNNGWAYYHLGDAYAKDGKVEEARGALGLGLSIAPWMAPARDLLNQLGG